MTDMVYNEVLPVATRCWAACEDPQRGPQAAEWARMHSKYRPLVLDVRWVTVGSRSAGSGPFFQRAAPYVVEARAWKAYM